MAGTVMRLYKISSRPMDYHTAVSNQLVQLHLCSLHLVFYRLDYSKATTLKKELFYSNT